MPFPKQGIKKGPIEIFTAYSHKDERLRNKLESHLSLLKQQGVITAWHDRKIVPGKDWEKEIDKHLSSAAIILLLISSDFLESTYCYGIEMTRALRRHRAGTAVVIPVILRPVDWHGAPFGKLQALPKDGKSVVTWPTQDAGFLDVARGVRTVIDGLAAKSKSPVIRTTSSARPVSPGVVPSTPTGRTKIISGGTVPDAESISDTSGKRPLNIVPKKRKASEPKDISSSIQSTASRQLITQATGYLNDAFRNRPRQEMGIAWLQIAWAWLNQNPSINPTEFLDDDFRRNVQNIGHNSVPSLLGYGLRNELQHSVSSLSVVQRPNQHDSQRINDFVEITLYANGTVSVGMNVTGRRVREISDSFASWRIDPDDVRERLNQAWGFASKWWSYRAKASRSTVSSQSFLYNVALLDIDNCRFEKPPLAHLNSFAFPMNMRTRPNPLFVYDEPHLVSGRELQRPLSLITDALQMLRLRFDELERQ